MTIISILLHQRYASVTPKLPFSTFSLETAVALYKALTLSSEERKHLAQMARQEVEHNDLATWIRQQLDDINALLMTSSAAT